ncbi:GNAT family N-acetyltransferase [Agromyces sp. NPDC060279]|uniref:GNAT family N-acetyltransferase n=1 Tax=Agromyces sp. NPDC060279 TaxID=3347092 RepID=UPI003664796D
MEIRQIPVPERLGVPAARDFEQAALLLAAIERETWGDDDFALSAAELLAAARGTHLRRVAFGAWDGDELLGRSSAVWDEDPEAESAEVHVVVAAGHRRRGIARALLAVAERAALDAGKLALDSFSDHPEASLGERGTGLTAPAATAGDAEIPADSAAAGFAAATGYALAQIERVSLLDTRGRTGAFRAQLVEAEASATAAGYRVVGWRDAAPDALVDAYAAAREHMSRDIPAGALQIDAERWDRARVRAWESELLAGGTTLLSCAVVDAAGDVAGYTVLELPPGRPVAYQDDTIVLRAHRGHRLGLLLKLANLVALHEAAPERTRVHTWNADENAHMLRINLGLGFRPSGLSAAWERRVAADHRPPSLS